MSMLDFRSWTLIKEERSEYEDYTYEYRLPSFRVELRWHGSEDVYTKGAKFCFYPLRIRFYQEKELILSFGHPYFHRIDTKFHHLPRESKEDLREQAIEIFLAYVLKNYYFQHTLIDLIGLDLTQGEEIMYAGGNDLLYEEVNPLYSLRKRCFKQGEQRDYRMSFEQTHNGKFCDYDGFDMPYDENLSDEEVFRLFQLFFAERCLLHKKLFQEIRQTF